MVSLLDRIIASRYYHRPATENAAYQYAFLESEILERDTGQIIVFFFYYEFKRFSRAFRYTVTVSTLLLPAFSAART